MSSAPGIRWRGFVGFVVLQMCQQASRPCDEVVAKALPSVIMQPPWQNGFFARFCNTPNSWTEPEPRTRRRGVPQLWSSCVVLIPLTFWLRLAILLQVTSGTLHLQSRPVEAPCRCPHLRPQRLTCGQCGQIAVRAATMRLLVLLHASCLVFFVLAEKDSKSKG